MTRSAVYLGTYEEGYLLGQTCKKEGREVREPSFEVLLEDGSVEFKIGFYHGYNGRLDRG